MHDMVIGGAILSIVVKQSKALFMVCPMLPSLTPLSSPSHRPSQSPPHSYYYSVLLGKLFGNTWFGCPPPNRMKRQGQRRQTTDNRVRVGRSTAISAKSFFRTFRHPSSGGALRQPLDPNMVELKGMGSHSGNTGNSGTNSTLGSDSAEETKADPEDYGFMTVSGSKCSR